MTVGHRCDSRLIAALISVTCVGIGTNLAMQLVNLGMHTRGVSAPLIGLSTMLQAGGVVAAAPLAPGLMRRLGVRNTVIVGALVAAVAMALFAQLTDFLALTMVRVLYACGLATVFTCAEFLVLVSVPRQARGWSAGLYSTCLGLGMAAGPMAISAFGLDGKAVCYIGVVACTACLPAALVGIPRDLAERRARRRLTCAGVSPLAFAAAVTFGFLDNGPVSLLGVYGMHHGWPAAGAAMLVSAVTIGAIACQTPIGQAVDRYDAATVFRVGCLFAVCVLLALPRIWHQPAAVLACVVALGAIMEGLYTVGLADIGKRAEGAEFSAANACFVTACGAGEIVGPALTGWVIAAIS